MEVQKISHLNNSSRVQIAVKHLKSALIRKQVDFHNKEVIP
jgi:hypothetical protein